MPAGAGAAAPGASDQCRSRTSLAGTCSADAVSACDLRPVSGRYEITWASGVSSAAAGAAALAVVVAGFVPILADEPVAAVEVADIPVHDVKPAGQRDTAGRELGVSGVTGDAAATAESAVVP